MGYEQEQRLIQAKFFKGKGEGRFRTGLYPFVLKEDFRINNLYKGIENQAIEYFMKNKIGWWQGKDKMSTNHTLSSQVACVNHLYWLNNVPEAATAVLQEINPEFVALPFPETANFVEFELNGCDKNYGNYLGESGRTRGANTTSIDAAMLAKKKDEKILVFIEWKYVERYYEKPNKAKEKSNYEVRKNIYKKLLTDDNSPIILDKNNENSSCDYDESYEKFSVEPFYQLMRQTLLAWQLSKNKRYGATDYVHIHAIPNNNTTLLKGKTSIEITNGSDNICEGWATWLKDPNKYIHLDPSKLLYNAAKQYNEQIFKYLNDRYWS